MKRDHAQPLLAADPASVHALVDAQPGLTPAESAFMRLNLLRSTVAADTPEEDR